MHAFFLTNKFAKLSSAQVQMREEEIKRAVWGCEGSKAPDGFTFTFLKNRWNLLRSEVIDFVHEFEAKGRLAKDCNLTFHADSEGLRSTGYF